MSIKVAINWKYTGKVPRSKMGDFNGQFKNMEFSEFNFIEAVHSGHAYTTWHDGYRNSDNFICGQTPALDLDTEDERSTFEHLEQDPFIVENALFLHTTPSHTPSNPRCRVVFCLEEEIYDKEQYATILAALVEKYPYADSACKDVSRFFYSSKWCNISRIGERLTGDVVQSELIEPYLEKQEQEEIVSTPVVAAEDVPDFLLRAKAKSLIQHVLNAPDGQKANTLNKIAYTFSGYVITGYYDENTVRQWLREAILQRSVKSKRVALQTIENGLRDGKQDPCYFHRDKYGIFGSDPVSKPEHQPRGNPDRTVEHELQFFLSY